LKKNNPPVIALTAGEPAGIGPDLCVQLAQQPRREQIVVVANARLLEERARQLKLPWRSLPANAASLAAGEMPVMDIPMTAAVTPGRLDRANAPYVLSTLEAALAGCLGGRFDAIVTAPVHKGVINDAGVPFTGHTEFFAERTQTAQVVMMLIGGGMRVALATTHLAVKEIAAHLTPASLETTIRILHKDMVERFGFATPRVAVAGLNPHAGESGHLGREEIEVIVPVMEKLRAEGMQLAGPLPADTLFNPVKLKEFDCVLTMYHDQGLPVLKYASFGHGVNVTLGLPVIRTSVDHGTALDLAGTGKADAGSLHAAIELAAALVRGRT
jgi:4-hydroxythreonine-4-phosphate dehydrogenase